MLDKGSVVDAIRKLLGKSAPPICPKRPIIPAVNKILRYARSTSAGKIGIMRNNNNWNKALRDLQFLSRLELHDVETHVVHLLKFSYYRLTAADVRKCFLYAAA